jgi:hypothetical protein
MTGAGWWAWTWSHNSVAQVTFSIWIQYWKVSLVSLLYSLHCLILISSLYRSATGSPAVQLIFSLLLIVMLISGRFSISISYWLSSLVNCKFCMTKCCFLMVIVCTCMFHFLQCWNVSFTLLYVGVGICTLQDVKNY